MLLPISLGFISSAFRSPHQVGERLTATLYFVFYMYAVIEYAVVKLLAPQKENSECTLATMLPEPLCSSYTIARCGLLLAAHLRANYIRRSMGRFFFRA